MAYAKESYHNVLLGGVTAADQVEYYAGEVSGPPQRTAAQYSTRTELRGRLSRAFVVTEASAQLLEGSVVSAEQGVSRFETGSRKQHE